VPRTVQPELLDALPIGHPDALRSRGDMRLFNAFMRNYRWIQRVVPPRLQGTDRVLEMGAGAGELGKLVAADVPSWDGLDLWPRPREWPGAFEWHESDLLAFAGWGDYSVLVANLFLHQFKDDELRALGKTWRSTARVLVFSEPARAQCFQWGFRLLCTLVGANYVSRHDGAVSIAAGFRGQELPLLLGLSKSQWSWRVHTSLGGAYRLIAERRK